jgi:serine/threonine protein phosphatase PrpC
LLLALLIVRAAFGNTSGITKIEFGYSQTPGNRQVNADELDWAYYEGQYFFAVADGTGPGDKAKTAARIAVHILARVFERTGVGDNPAYFFSNCFRGANSTILRYIPDGSAGASLLGAAVKDNLLYYALAGNCKLSVYRDGEIYDLSEGHTIDVLARQAFLMGELSRLDALAVARKNRPYNFVGKDGFRDLEMFDTPVALKRGDIILLMTDGVYEFCPTGTLSEILRTRASCRTMAKNITNALDRNNHPEQDNGAVILARVNAL